MNSQGNSSEYWHLDEFDMTINAGEDIIELIVQMSRQLSADTTALSATGYVSRACVNEGGGTMLDLETGNVVNEENRIVLDVEYMGRFKIEYFAGMFFSTLYVGAAAQIGDFSVTLSDGDRIVTNLARAVKLIAASDVRVSVILSWGLGQGGSSGADGPSTSTPAGPSSSTPAGPSSSTPAGPSTSTPAGPSSSTPAGPSSSTSARPCTSDSSSTRARPSSTPARPSTSDSS